MFARFFMIVAIVTSTFLTAALADMVVVNYNVENLFDSTHDEGKNDWEFLPKNYPGKIEGCQKANEKNSRYLKQCLETDWTENKVQLKIQQNCKAVKLAVNGALPDVLTLSEVENANVLSRFARHCGFSRWLISNSPDERGIDVALLYNENSSFRMVDSKSHTVTPATGQKPTRDILQVTFQTHRGQKIHFFINHWPSQGAPTVARLAAAETLKNITKQILTKSPGDLIVATGDFNVTPIDRPDPFFDVLENTTTGLGLLDLHKVWLENSKRLSIAVSKYPTGTYFYPPGITWNILDRAFFSPQMLNEKSAVRVDIASYAIYGGREISKPFIYSYDEFLYGTSVSQTPWGYDHRATTVEKAGYSDHYPIKFKLLF